MRRYFRISLDRRDEDVREDSTGWRIASESVEGQTAINHYFVID
jgi:hypothetical protein